MRIPFDKKPAQIVCGGGSFAAHNAEADAAFGKLDPDIDGLPWCYVKSPQAVIWHGEPIRLRDIRHATRAKLERPYGTVSGEVELGVVIQGHPRSITPAEARDYIRGFTIFNDISQRELFASGYCASFTKGAPTFSPIASWMLPRDEVTRPQNLAFELRVNGTPKMKGNLAEMIFSIEDLLSFISKSFDLGTGDIITTGSPPGFLGYHLEPGDIVECEIEQIGILRNPVVFA